MNRYRLHSWRPICTHNVGIVFDGAFEPKQPEPSGGSSSDGRPALRFALSITVVLLALVSFPSVITAKEPAFRVSLAADVALSQQPSDSSLPQAPIVSGDPESLPSPATPNRNRDTISSRVWMDIRPRSLEPARLGRITTDELPADESGLSALPDSPQRVQIYRVDLQIGDVCAGARFHHRPLYFEDQKLERSGVVSGVLGHVPAVRSGLHFASSAAALPLHMLKEPPHQCVTSGCVCR